MQVQDGVGFLAGDEERIPVFGEDAREPEAGGHSGKLMACATLGGTATHFGGGQLGIPQRDQVIGTSRAGRSEPHHSSIIQSL